MQGTRDYIKFIKRGYGRISQNIATELRQENLEKFDAEKLIKHEGKKPQSLKIFLDYIGLNEEEFNKICQSMSVPPYKHDFKTNEFAEKTWDYDEWYKEKTK